MEQSLLMDYYKALDCAYYVEHMLCGGPSWGMRKDETIVPGVYQAKQCDTCGEWVENEDKKLCSL